MAAHQHQPGQPLSRFVEHFWLLDGHVPANARDRIFPDGGIEVMFNLGAPQQLYPSGDGPCAWFHTSWVSGMRTRSIVIGQMPAASMVGVRFKPWGAYRFLGVPMIEVADRVIDLEAIWGRYAREVRERLGLAPSPAACFAVLEALLLRKLAEERREERIAVWVAGQLQHSLEKADIGELARRLGVSRKQLQRAFRSVVGVAPKAFARVQRFQRAIHRIGWRPTVDWANLAAECGYYDQAHFIKEFKEFSELTPTAYLARRGPYLNYVAAES